MRFIDFVDIIKEQKTKKKVFLGGTCNGSKWREQFVDKISNMSIDYFNPVVDNWTEECQKEELRQREICDYLLYVITPKIKGVYSIAEVVDDSNKKPKKTIFCFLEEDGDDVFDESQLKSLDAVGKMIERNGSKYYKNIDDVINYLKECSNNGI
ncbi:MAG: nucleoside 2-deoxyribosyltransferase domain-containing protein [bacterium]